MKVTANPSLVAFNKIQVPIESQYGVQSFASFQRIVAAMKASGEMRCNAEVIGIEIHTNGLSFVYKD